MPRTHTRTIQPACSRWLLAVVLLAALAVVGCRAVAAGVAAGAIAGFIVVTAAHYDPPTSYHVHYGDYYYHDSWHDHPPRRTTVNIYFYKGKWYRRQGYQHGPYDHHPR